MPIISPLAKIIAKAEQQITDWFYPTAMDMAHDRKRQLAESVLAGAEPTPEFVDAAAIENVTPDDLASIIVAKPNDLMVRENARRAAIIRVRGCTSADQVKQLLADLGVLTKT